jgi:hypothetical protein
MELTTDAILGIAGCIVAIALVLWTFRDRL